MSSPEPKHSRITNAEDNFRPPVFWQTPVQAGGFVEQNGFNCVEGFWKRLQATLFYKGLLLCLGLCAFVNVWGFCRAN